MEETTYKNAQKSTGHVLIRSRGGDCDTQVTTEVIKAELGDSHSQTRMAQALCACLGQEAPHPHAAHSLAPFLQDATGLGTAHPDSHPRQQSPDSCEQPGPRG